MKNREEGFIDHGIAAKAEEQRTSVLCKGKDENYYFVTCSRGFVVSINLNTGIARQTVFPEGHIDFPYGSIGSNEGLVYTGAGNMFMEFDPSKNSFTYHSYPVKGDEIAGFGFAEDKEGNIYFGSYPSCYLFCYNPGTKAITDYGRMDETEMYVGSMAAEDSGWVYMGIGTERKGIVAFNPHTGEKRQLIQKTQRVKGSGYVHKGRDGRVYGHGTGEHKQSFCDSKEWFLLQDGKMIEIKRNEVSQCCYYRESFSTIHSPFIDGSIIQSCDLPEGEVIYKNPGTNENMKVCFKYETEGAELSPIVAGPDGNIYGTTNHPFQFFSFNPKKNEMTNWGGRVLQQSVGNICAYAQQGTVIGGAAYCGGFIIIHDTSRRINKINTDTISTNCKSGNPTIVAIHEEINRPRCAVAHPDGKHMIFGGFAGYGAVGGALCIYNVETGEDILIKNEDLLPYHSTLCMRVLENGDLICGTSIETPGGAHPKAEEGELYRLDWKTHKVIYRTTPIPNAREISLMELDRNQLIHCITCNSIYFVFDPAKKQVLYKQDLSRYGEVVRDGIAKGQDGKIYGLLSKAIYSIDPETYSVDILAEPDSNITSGIAILEGRLYFGADSHLWSYQL